MNKITKINYLIKNKRKIFPSRDFVNILDLLKVIHKILKITLKRKKSMKILNVSSEVSTPINKVIKILKKKDKKNFKINHIKIAKQEFEHTKGSNKELYKYIKFVPKKRLKLY